MTRYSFRSNVSILTVVTCLILVLIISHQSRKITHKDANPLLFASHADNDAKNLHSSIQHGRNGNLDTRKVFWVNGFPLDHPLKGVFEPIQFPDKNYIMWLGNMILEGLMILECGYRKVSGMTAGTESKSFKRYFRDEDLQQVTYIFEDIMETIGFMWGFASDPDYKPGECNQRPWLLPIKVYYEFARVTLADECDKGMQAYVDVLPPDGTSPDPGSTKVKPYIVVCPRLFDRTSSSEPTCRPRTLDDRGDTRWPGTYATYVGENTDEYPNGGVWSAGASIAHEIMHLDNIHTSRTGELSIVDNQFIPSGWKKTITAYTGWQCQELKRVKPEKAHLNDNNYIFFALEEWWMEHLPTRSPPSSVDFTDAPVDYPEDRWPDADIPIDGKPSNQ